MSVTSVDYLVVGSGLTGATIARQLADAGCEVLILERRAHVGGNVHDIRHTSGARVHAYGPHYFRCSSPRIWDFVTRFAEFRPYYPVVKVLIDGRYQPWPINQSLLDGWSPPACARRPRNFEEACLQKLPLPVYEAYIKGYTRKQWGVNPRQLRPELARRIRVNRAGQSSLMPQCVHQALPADGYAVWMNAMLDGIPCLHGVDYLQRREEFHARKLLISTGSIDEFFRFDEGRLLYRGQQRTVKFLAERNSFRPCVQVNYPQDDPSGPIRTIEWKHLLPPNERATIRGTVITHETPYSPTNPDAFEYPFPDSQNEALYRRYRARAARNSRLLICGRLGDYRYYDMDQAIGRALLLADRILAPSYSYAQSTS